MTSLTRRGRGLLLAVVAVPSFAQGQPADEAEAAATAGQELRRYTVELIVFEYVQSTAAGNEIFVPDELPQGDELLPMLPRTYGDPGTNSGPDLPVAIDDAEIYTDDSLEFLLPDESREPAVLEEFPSHILQTRLEVLDPAMHAMPGIYQKLLNLEAYRPIMRAAWTQATFEKDQSLPIRLRRLGNAPLRLDGTVMLYLSRYLHFVVDLTIEAQHEQSAGQSNVRTRNKGDRRSYRDYGFAYGQEPRKIKYSISEDRIFRNGELRYYDHPKFGVLARVTRFEEEDMETDEMFLLPAEPVGQL